MNKAKLIDINNRALEIVECYQNIKTPKGVCVPTPYFINAVETIYRKVFADVGVEIELINNAIKKIREGATPLGSMVGKGTPQQIEKDLAKLAEYMKDRYKVEIEEYPICEIQGFMKSYHIGIDCSGFVYNVLKYAFGDNLFNSVSKMLKWQDSENKRATRVGVFVFNTDNLHTVSNYSQLQPLDLAIFKDNTHMGVILNRANVLYLVDSSTGRGGITFSEVLFKDNDTVEFEDRDIWNARIPDDLLFKRFSQLEKDND